MSRCNRLWIILLVFGCIELGFAGASGLAETQSDHNISFGFGRSVTESEIKAWDIDIAPDGKGLPAGQGSVMEGENVYREHCASCHGNTGVEGPMPKLVGGQGTLNTDHPVKTVGSYWPYGTTLFDYIFSDNAIDVSAILSPS